MRIYVDNPYFIDFLEHLQRWCSVCGLAKIFFTSEFSYLLFCNPTHKTETGTQQISNGGLLIANHMVQSLWWANQEHWAVVRSYLLHSFLEVHSIGCWLVRLSPAIANCTIMLSRNHFPDLNQHILTSLHPILLCGVTYWAPLEMLLHSCTFIFRIILTTFQGRQTMMMMSLAKKLSPYKKIRCFLLIGLFPLDISNWTDTWTPTAIDIKSERGIRTSLVNNIICP
jgi:hypothetical protein